MRRLSVVAFVLMVSVVASGVLQADETPTPEAPTLELPTATLEPTWTTIPTLTPEPSLTWTSVSTVTETPTATQTETPTITLEAGISETPTPTSTHSLEASPTDTASATITTQISPTMTVTSTFDPFEPPPPTITSTVDAFMPDVNQSMFQPNSVPTIEYRDAPDVGSLGAAIVEAMNNRQNIYVISLTNDNGYDLTAIHSDTVFPDDSWVHITTAPSYPNTPHIFIIGNPITKTTIRTNSNQFRWLTIQGIVVLKHLIIEDFVHAGSGSALYNHGKLYLYDVLFRGNSTQRYGGSLANVGSVYGWNVEFEGNTSLFSGGAISNEDAGRIELRCARFQGNEIQIGTTESGASLRQTGQIESQSGVSINQSNFIQPRAYEILQLQGSGPVNADGNFWDDVTPTGLVSGTNTSVNNPASNAFPLSCPEPEEVKVPTSGCDSGFVRLASPSPTAPIPFRQEYKDMRAVVALDSSEQQSIGLYLHDGPTWNSRGEDLPVLYWGTVVPVNGRIELRNDTVGFLEIWYRHKTQRAPYGDVWFLAYTTTSQNQTYSYVQGVDPCLELVTELTNTSQAITFSYDRASAAKYAMAHAYRNSIKQAEPDDYPYSDGTRATNRITPTLYINGQPIPYATIISYAKFTYQNTQTNSSRFISESIWMGGMPMTYSLDNNNVVNPLENCGDGNSLDDSHLSYSGWRYCGGQDLGHLNSAIWKSHTGIIAYFSRFYTGGWENGRPRKGGPGYINPIIDVHGDMVALIDINSTDQIVREVSQKYGRPVDGLNLLGTYEPNPSIFTQLQIDFYQDITSKYAIFNSGFNTLQPGDYIVVNRQVSDDYRHGFLIIGWAKPISCAVALGQVWILDEASLKTTYSANLVPYVVDFAGGVDIDDIEDRQHQTPRPRPFYCALYDEYGDDPQYKPQIITEGFGFFTLPNVTTVSANKLYTQSLWTWAAEE